MSTATKSASLKAKLPAYLRVREDLLQKIKSGEFVPGQRLLDDRSMAAQYKVSRETICRAMKLLCQEHVIERTQGRGTFVSNKRSQSRKIAAIYYRNNVPGDQWTLSVLRHLIRGVTQHGGEVVSRIYHKPSELEPDLAALQSSEEMAGGVVISACTPNELQQLRQHFSLPLVMIGDMTSASRNRLYVDQVTGSTTELVGKGVKYLTQHGCKNVEMVAISRECVWNQDAIESFSQELGVAPDSEKLRFASDAIESSSHDVDDFYVSEWVEAIVGDWVSRNRIPDGLYVHDTRLFTKQLSAFRRRGITSQQMPRFAVNVPMGMSIDLAGSDVKGVALTGSMDKIIHRALQRLQEKADGDTSLRLEMVGDIDIQDIESIAATLS